MRNLTITRRKKFAGCAGKVKVYVEDGEYDDLKINGVSCRMLGYLANGDTQTFSVPEDACRIYVIGDKLSRNICNECYALPAGTEDVKLEGQIVYSFIQGNPFRFDGNEGEEAKAAHKKSKIVGLVLVICAFIVGFSIAFLPALAGESESKTFTSNGVSITLTDDFTLGTEEGYNLACYADDIVCLIFTEDVTGTEIATEDAYAEALLAVSGIEADLLRKEEMTCFEYKWTDESDGSVYQYLLFVKNTGDNVFCVTQFVCDSAVYSLFEPQMVAWAKTVAVSAD